ncbi:GNAT family N-acetyltransferase [Robiginitalea sp.]|nr:GNAT family N-acetyltransferase [Robiginitalea sp.]
MSLITTPRLAIRPIEQSDAAFMQRLVNTDGWLRFIGDRNVHSVNDAEGYISKILDTPNFYYNVVELNDSRVPIGVVSFIYREGYDFPDLGFALLPECCGQGYAEEAARGYLEYLMQNETLTKILGIVNSDNIHSIRLLEKLGFVLESQRELDERITLVFGRNV